MIGVDWTDLVLIFVICIGIEPVCVAKGPLDTTDLRQGGAFAPSWATTTLVEVKLNSNNNINNNNNSNNNYSNNNLGNGEVDHDDNGGDEDGHNLSVKFR